MDFFESEANIKRKVPANMKKYVYMAQLGFEWFLWYLFSILITIHSFFPLFLKIQKEFLAKSNFCWVKRKVKACVYHAKLFDGRLTWKWTFICKTFHNEYICLANYEIMICFYFSSRIHSNKWALNEYKNRL